MPLDNDIVSEWLGQDSFNSYVCIFQSNQSQFFPDVFQYISGSHPRTRAFHEGRNTSQIQLVIAPATPGAFLLQAQKFHRKILHTAFNVATQTKGTGNYKLYIILD